jgi:deoxyribodipyrimidine photolyase-related protein
MWILFPNQIFDEEILRTIPDWKKEHFILWEDPLFYGIRPDSDASSSLSLNKLRIVYQKWLWNNYIEYLQKRGVQVKIIPFEEIATKQKSLQVIRGLVKNATAPVCCFDPEDLVLKKRWKNLPIQWINSPMFLATSKDLDTYMKSHGSSKKLQHSHFYQYMKQNVLISLFPHIKIPDSKDIENRKPLPNDFPLPKLPYSLIKQDVPKSLQHAITWCHLRFPKNYGPANLQEAVETYLVHLPSNSKEAFLWWVNFRKQRFAMFGPYEDAIHSQQPILFHSFCAMLLNFGLLTPGQILKDVFQHYTFNQKPELISSIEGFVRQLAGWREYSRLYYRYVSPEIYRKNIFQHSEKLGKEWYVPSETSLPPIVQEAVKDAWNTGYLHHIRRLMVVSNYMNLTYIDPEEVYTWMYEFSLDSWEWVMVFNVYSMGTWSDEGYAMRKPYVSSPNYLLTMSNTSSGPWVQEWKKKYDMYLQKHKNILRHTIYAYQLEKKKLV